MSLEAEWKKAKKAFEDAGGNKNVKTGVEPACKALDSAYEKLEKAKASGDQAKITKAAKDFDAAVAKMNDAFNKLAKFTGLSVSTNPSAKEKLLNAGHAILNAAKKAKTDLLNG